MDNGNIKIEQAPSWGSSVPVANVQEMARRNPLSVPNKYTRDLDDRPNLSPVSSDIPVIDLPLLSDGSNEEELKKLDLACKNWGFFQVINHGVAEVLQNMRDIASNFFKLPLGEKNKYAMANNDIQGKLEFWPMTPPELREAIETYSAGVNKVAQRLLGHLSLMMGLEKDVLLGMHKEVMQALHVNYYPPCSVPDHWVTVKPIPNAFVVNIGDCIEALIGHKFIVLIDME